MYVIISALLVYPALPGRSDGQFLPLLATLSLPMSSEALSIRVS